MPCDILVHMRLRSLKSALICVIALLACGPVAGQQAKKYDALLWKISGPGLAKPSYLYGTMHVSNKVAFQLSEEFFTALDQCDRVALEMDPSSWLGELVGSQWFSTFYNMRANSSGAVDLYRDAFKLDFTDRKGIAAALAQDPEMVNELLYRMTAGNTDHEEDTYLDLFIYQCAGRAGKSVVGLESMEHSMVQLMRAITPDGRDPDPIRQRRIREYYMQGGDPNTAIEDAYRAQDLDRVDTMFDLAFTDDRMRKFVINERNVTFLDALLPHIMQHAVFIGVGAAHLPGENGMIAMLRAKGYIVEPVHGAVTAQSRSTQRKYEGAYRAVTWGQQWAADSAFTMELPAPLYELPLSSGSGTTLAAADMVNGSHFLVQRIPTYAALRGRTDEDVMLQVDSALYEGVPGRIESTKHFRTNNGWPGVDVRSIDRLGRAVHHKVVVSPFEIFVFERTMRDLPQAKKDGDRAFASIRFHEAPLSTPGDWGPTSGGYTVALPALRRIDEREPSIGWLTEAPLEQLHTAQAISANGLEGFLTMSAYYPDMTTLEQDTFELAVLAEEYAKTMGLEVVHHGAVTPSPPSVRSSGRWPQGDSVHFMITLVGARYDLLCARASKASADQFFASYRPTPYEQRAPLIAFSDTLMHFSVRTASTYQELMKSIAGFGEFFREMMRNARALESGHEREHRAMLYRSTTTPEAVLVEFERFQRFITFENETEFWDERVEELRSGASGSVVKDRRMQGPLESRQIDLVLTDSACSRTVRVMMRQCPGALYTLRAIGDREGQVSAWADSFMVSFRTDTTFGEGIFQKKGGTLLRWIAEGDSAQLKQARASFYVADFADADAPALMSYIDSKEARDEEHGRRNQALLELGGLKDPRIVPFLRAAYASAGDTAEVRFNVLQALAAQKSKLGADAFMDLVIADPPLTDSEWLVNGAFSPFYDSLAIALRLFPQAWSLTQFKEFEAPVLRLAAALVEKKLMAPTAYATRKAELLIKGRAELKRSISGAKQDDPDYAYDDDEESPTASMRNYVWGWNVDFGKEEEIVSDHGAQEMKQWTALYEAYHRLLFPFMKEEGIKAYFDMAMNSGADEVELPTATFLMKNGGTVPPEFWKRYSARDDARLWSYRTLQALGHVELFDTLLLTPEKNATAYMLSGQVGSQADSVRLIGTREGVSRLGRGPIHFYATRITQDEKPDQWSLSCTGFFAEGDTAPFADRFIYSAMEELSDLAEAEKGMQDTISDMRYLGRKRWRSDGNMLYPPPPDR